MREKEKGERDFSFSSSFSSDLMNNAKHRDRENEGKSTSGEKWGGIQAK